MNTNAAKIATAVVLLVAFAAGTLFVYYQIGLLKSVEMPRMGLDTLPMELGEWKGEQRDTDERLFRAIGAEEVVSRRYANPAGRELSLHAATFVSRDDRLPHSPLVCYPSAGWTLVEQTSETLEVPDSPPLVLQFVTFESGGRRSLVAYWYQFGEYSLFDEFGMREAKSNLRDNKKWPALIKVLVDIDASNRDQAKRQLTEFVKRVYAWSSRVQKGEASIEPLGKSADAATTAE